MPQLLSVFHRMLKRQLGLLVCLLLFLLLLLPNVALDAAEYVLSADLQKKIDEHNQTVAKIVEDAKQDIQKQQIKVLGLLEKELRNETKKGNFEQAQAITKIIAEQKKTDDVALSLFGKDVFITPNEPRFTVLKVAFAEGEVEKQGSAGPELIKYVQDKLNSGTYIIDLKTELASILPKGISYNLAWIDYSLDGGPKIYQAAHGAEFRIEVPEPKPKE